MVPKRKSKVAIRLLAALGFIAVCFAVSALAQLAAGGTPGEWYRGLRKPAFQPPNWLFGPVWTVLYVCMALAAWLVWSAGGFRRARGALVLFAVQLVLNGAWTPLFFGLHRPGIAFVELVALWVAIVLTTWRFFRIRAPAGVLMLPYLAWVSFAGVLNFAIWRLNA